MGTKRIRTPSAERQSALEAATQLMGERAKYEKWLDDLEAKKDSTPPKVFDRVRQDYLTRLQSVMEQLGQHTATLQEHAENLAAKLRELEEAEETNTEEQAEAALRKQVGEMTAAEWETGSRKAQRELSKLQENQAVISEELNQIQDLLGEDEEEEEEAEKKGSKDFNELEFLTKVVGEEPPTPPAVLPTRVSAPTTQRPTPTAVPATRVSAPTPQRSTPSAPPAAQAAPAAPAAPAVPPTPASQAAAPPSAPAPPPSAVPAAPPPSRPAAPAASPVAAASPAPSPATDKAPSPPAMPATPPGQTPIKGRQTEAQSVLSDSEVAEQPKTLRCTECNAMNYPSEWYCERCGAELTVV